MSKKNRNKNTPVTQEEEVQELNTELLDVVTETIQEPVVEPVAEPERVEVEELGEIEEVDEVPSSTEEEIKEFESQVVSDELNPIAEALEIKDEVEDTPDEIIEEKEEEKVEEPVQTAPSPEPEVKPEVEVVSKPADVVKKRATLSAKSKDEPSDELLAQAREWYGRDQHKINWTKKECQDAIEHRKLPAMTSRGNWVNDTKRLSRISELSATELEDFVAGEITVKGQADNDLFWEEVYSRWSICPNVTLDDAKALILEGKEPEYVEHLVLKNDRSRDLKKLDQLSYREVRAALLGKITINETKEALESRLLDVLNVTNKNAIKSLLSSLEEKVYGTMEIQILEARLDEYKRTRSTTPRVDRVKVGDVNAMLLRITRQLIKKDYKEFKEGWNAILDFVQREKNGILSPRRRFEHWDQVPLQGAELETLSDLITLWCNSSDPVVRNSGLDAEQVRVSVRNLGKEDDINKVIAFYSGN